MLQVRTGLEHNGRLCQLPCGQAKSDGGHGDHCDHRRDGNSRHEGGDPAGNDQWQRASASGGALCDHGHRDRDDGLGALVYKHNADAIGLRAYQAVENGVSLCTGRPICTRRDHESRRATEAQRRVCRANSCCMYPWRGGRL